MVDTTKRLDAKSESGSGKLFGSVRKLGLKC